MSDDHTTVIIDMFCEWLSPLVIDITKHEYEDVLMGIKDEVELMIQAVRDDIAKEEEGEEEDND
jgi:hypothetical protein